MKSFSFRALLCSFLAVFFLSTNVQAADYRGGDGTLISFYQNGQCALYVDGEQILGSWWWTNAPYQFQMNVRGVVIYGTQSNDKRSMVVNLPGHGQQYLNYVGSRGAKSDEKPDDASWFMDRVMFGE